MEHSVGLLLFFVIGFFGQVGFFADVWKGQMPFWVGFGLQLFPFIASYLGMSMLEESESRRWAWWGGRFAEWGLQAYLGLSVVALFVAAVGLWRPVGWVFFLILIVLGLLPGVVFWRGLRGWRLALLSRTSSNPMGWDLQRGQHGAAPQDADQNEVLAQDADQIALDGEGVHKEALAQDDDGLALEGEEADAWEEIRGMLEEAALGESSRWARLPKEEVQHLGWLEKIKRIGWDPFLMGAVFGAFVVLTVWLHLRGGWEARPLMLWASYAMWGGGLLFCFMEVIQRGGAQSLRLISPVRARTRRLWKLSLLFVASLVGCGLLFLAWREEYATTKDRWLLGGVAAFYVLMIFPALRLLKQHPLVFYALNEEGLLEKHPEGTLLWPWAMLSWSSLQENSDGVRLSIGIEAVPLQGATERPAFSAALRETLAGLRWEPQIAGEKKDGEHSEQGRLRVIERSLRRYLTAAQSVDWDGESYLSCAFVKISEEEAEPSLVVLMEHLADKKESM